jgi:hypothetical protein
MAVDETVGQLKPKRVNKLPDFLTAVYLFIYLVSYLRMVRLTMLSVARSRDSLVGRVMSYGLDDRVSIPGKSTQHPDRL